MRCFVTGGGGFIGSRAVRQILAKGWDLAILARPGERLRRLGDIETRIHVLQAELSQVDSILSFLRSWRPESCLHLAWYTEPGEYLDSERNIECMNGSIALLEGLIATGCKTVVMAGTCAECDTELGLLKEDSILQPATLYAASKAATYLVAGKLAAQANMNLIWARLFYLFGPGEDPRRMVPAVIQAMLQNCEFSASAGNQVRDYIHVDDAASALVTLMCEDVAGVFNVCSGQPVTIRRLMEMIGEQIGRGELIRFGSVAPRAWDPPFVCGDSTKLRQLGWRPRYELREALNDTIEYWRAEIGRGLSGR